MNKVNFYALSLLFSFSTASFANHFDQYHTIKTIEVKEISDEGVTLLSSQKVEDSDLNLFMEKMQNDPFSEIGAVIKVTKELIAFGEEVYKVIEKGRPVVNLNSAPISVLPRDNSGKAVNAFYLTKWKEPKSKKFLVEAKNYLGATPVSFEFTVIFSYGGKYNDKGAYINAAQIIPTKAHVGWGYSLDANFSVQQITNLGTSDFPVASMVLSMNYKVTTVLKEANQNALFFIDGNGNVKSL